jgi:hypothetical protein
MTLTIDQLHARINCLETHIQALLSSKSTLKHNNASASASASASGFKSFAKAVRHHVRSYLFNIHFTNTGHSNFNPKNTDILIEISAMWNDISYEEKLHWAALR